MRGLATFGHHWLMHAEHGVLRVLLVVIGAVLTLIGLGLDVTIVMLPAGLALGFTGLAILTWGIVGEIPEDD